MYSYVCGTECKVLSVRSSECQDVLVVVCLIVCVLGCVLGADCMWLCVRMYARCGLSVVLSVGLCVRCWLCMVMCVGLCLVLSVRGSVC